MSTPMTLAEHKAARLAEEANETEETTQVETEEVEELATEEEETETESVAADEDEDETEAEQEPWMQSEADDSQSNGSSDEQVENGSAAGIRKKYQGIAKREATEAEDKHRQEMDEIRAEMAAIKGQNNTAKVAPTDKPKREDFYDKDEPDEAYLDAMFEWRDSQSAQRNQQATQQSNQSKALAAQESALDDHYSRAEKLPGIKAEEYQQSDRQVRSVLGDDITTALITNMGEGSEKVFFNLGRNPKKLAELQLSLQQDPNGLKAMMLLGKMSSTFSAPNKKKSLAPAPAANAKGDAQTSRTTKTLQNAYAKASKSGDGQKAFDIKKEARASGIDTNSW